MTKLALDHPAGRSRQDQPHELHERQPRKLASKKRSNTLKMGVWLDRDSAAALAGLRQFYRTGVGREVSYSLIMRRALGLLREHLMDMVKNGDKIGITAEIDAIRRCR